MKKLLLATAVAALCASTAQAAPTLYGAAKAGIHYDSYEVEVDGKKDDAKLDDFGSRFGIKGSSELGNGGTKAIYKFEYGLKLDQQSEDANGDAVSEEFAVKKRNAYLGLEDASFGTIKMGRFGGIDGDVNYSTVAPVAYDDIVGLQRDGDKTNNTVSYDTPDLGGLTAGGFYSFDETSVDGEEKDVYGVAGMYDADVVKVGVSYVDTGDKKTHMRVSAGTEFSGINLGVTYQMTELDEKDSETQSNIQVGGSYGYGSVTVFGQADMATSVGNEKKKDGSRYVGGVSFNVVEGTTDLHTYVGYTDPEGDDNNVMGLGAAVVHSF